MKFWFGKKEEDAPSKEEPAVAPAPAASDLPVKAPAEVLTIQGADEAPPPLTPSLPKEEPVSGPLQPATTLVRPQANQKVLYYQLMNGLYDAVMILDDNGHIVDANERVSSVLGYDRDEMWDMPVDTVVKGIGPQIFKQMKDALHNNHQVLINAKCTRKDGTVFQGEVGVCIMHLTRGENLVFTIRNVEKRIAGIKEQLLKSLAAAKPAATPVGSVRPVGGLKVVRPVGQSATPAASAPADPAAPAPGTGAVPTRRMVLKAVVKPTT